MNIQQAAETTHNLSKELAEKKAAAKKALQEYAAAISKWEDLYEACENGEEEAWDGIMEQVEAMSPEPAPPT